MSKVIVRFLGRPSITASDGDEFDTLGRKSVALLCILALSPNFVCTRERLLGILWGTRSQQQAQGSLRQVLSEVRRTLNLGENCPLVTDRTTVKLAEHLVEIDVLNCLDLMKSEQKADHERAAEIVEAGFAPLQSINEDYYDDWMARQYERIKEACRDALSELMRDAFEAGELRRARVFGRAVLRIEPGDEEAHRVLMEVYVREGNRGLALRQYAACCEILEAEYDAEPDARTAALYQSIKTPADGSELTLPELVEAPPVEAVETPQIAICSSMLNVDNNDVEAGRLATEFVEQLLGALSCFRWIDISRPRHRPTVDPSDADTPSTHFVIEGRVRRNASSLRVSLDVVEVSSGKIAFSEVFEDELTAEGVISELIIHKAAARTEERLRTSIVRDSLLKPDAAMTARESVLVALYGVQDMTLESYERAKRLFALAEKATPNFAFQYSCKALWMIFCYGQGWGDVQREDIHALAKRATYLDPEDATSLAIYGHMEVFCFTRFDAASDLFARASACNPHSPFVRMMRAVYHAYSGDAAAARRDLEMSSKISDLEAQYRFMYSSAWCILNLIDRNFEDAARWGRIMAASNPSFSNGIKQLLVSLGHLRRPEEARGYIEQLEQLEPDFSASAFVNSYPLKRPEDRAMFLDGLLAAGARA
ncbi:MAG: BTAD domain-containing putative transcriptional regulator [Pseudomonadota bacterium]